MIGNSGVEIAEMRLKSSTIKKTHSVHIGLHIYLFFANAVMGWVKFGNLGDIRLDQSGFGFGECIRG